MLQKLVLPLILLSCFACSIHSAEGRILTFNLDEISSLLEMRVSSNAKYVELKKQEQELKKITEAVRWSELPEEEQAAHQEKMQQQSKIREQIEVIKHAHLLKTIDGLKLEYAAIIDNSWGLESFVDVKADMLDVTIKIKNALIKE